MSLTSNFVLNTLTLKLKVIQLMPLQRVVRYYSGYIIYNTRNNWYSLWSTFTATTYVSLPLTVLAVFFHGFKKNFWGKELVGLIRVPLYTLPKAPSPISYSSVTRSPSTSQWSIIKPFFLQKREIRIYCCNCLKTL